MGTLRSLVWTALGAGFMCLHLTGHITLANALLFIWMFMFAYQVAVDLDDKDKEV